MFVLSEIVRISLIAFRRIFKKENGYPAILSVLAAHAGQCIAMAHFNKNLMGWENEYDQSRIFG